MITLPYCPPGGNLFFTPRGNNEEARDKGDDSWQHTVLQCTQQPPWCCDGRKCFAFWLFIVFLALFVSITWFLPTLELYFNDVGVGQRLFFHPPCSNTSWNAAGLLHRQTVIITLQTFSLGTFPVSSKSPGLAEVLMWYVRADVRWFRSSVERLPAAGATRGGVCSEQNVRCVRRTAAVFWFTSVVWSVTQFNLDFSNCCCSFFGKQKTKNVWDSEVCIKDTNLNIFHLCL